MKKILLLLMIFQAHIFGAHAQVTGDSVVCSGFTYNYSASIAGAVIYTWTLPGGWYGLTGQGSPSITATCNVNVGDICVEGFDTNSNSVGIECITTEWGNGGSMGWDIYPSSFYYCDGQPRDVHFMILPNGTGSTACPAGCGNGTQNPNLIYGLYDNSVPYPQFMAAITGAWITMPPVIATYHVFYVDTAAGSDFPDAVSISGGCGAAVVNNTVTTNMVTPLPPQFIQSPDPACVGDTVLITQTDFGITTIGWTAYTGLTILSYPDSNEVLVVVTNSYAQLSFDGFDPMYFCNTYGSYLLNTCTAPQVTGDTVVCSGYTYNYSASIPGAVTYTWTLPNGWYGLTGQGTSSITATCNINDGDICVEGFDANSNSVGIECITTQWGNGSGGGWDLQPAFVPFCFGDPIPVIVPTIVPNGTGTGTCPGGCGNGTQHSNLLYALYDSSVPDKLFMGVVDNVNSVNLPPLLVATYYVYFVDTTLGADFPDAVIISGGCGSASITNEMLVAQVGPSIPVFTQVPDPACIGDTVLIAQTGLIAASLWTPLSGLTVLSNPTPEQALVVITSTPAVINYEGWSTQAGCYSTAAYQVNITSCGPPAASFSAITNPICPGTCTGFTNLSTNATSYQWSFPGANPSSSNAVNPTNICYNTPGSYDVMLIATNAMGSDTFLLTNYITVYVNPPSQSIQQNGDTLISNTGFATYQWYYNGTVISGATNYFFIATLDGDYNVVCNDSNGCEVEAAIFNVMTSVQFMAADFGLNVYPNPAGNLISVFAGSRNTSPLLLEITDVTGRKINNQQILPNRKTQLSLDALAPGIYFVSVKGNETFAVKKIIKE